MKTLFILRHAKSSWDNPLLDDHERPLTETGISKTKKVAGFLLKKRSLPELIVSSTAVRAIETARIMAEEINYPAENIRQEPALYHASPDQISELIYALPDEINSVMIVGHNPALTYFVNQYQFPSIENLPTSGLAVIEFSAVNWQEIPLATFRVKFVVYPKML